MNDDNQICKLLAIGDALLIFSRTFCHAESIFTSFTGFYMIYFEE